MTDDEIIVKFEQLTTILKPRALFAYTVLLKSKLTVPRNLILKTRFSILDS